MRIEVRFVDVRPVAAVRVCAQRVLSRALGHDAAGAVVVRLGEPLPGTGAAGRRCHITLAGGPHGSFQVEALGADYFDALSRCAELARELTAQTRNRVAS